MVAFASHADKRPASIPILSRANRSTLIGFASVAAFLIIWQLAAQFGWVNARFTSRPTEVVVAAIEVFQTDDFLYHAGISLTELSLGFVLALLVSIPLGMLLGNSQVARDLISPPLMALYIAPTLVLLPIMVIWLGIGLASKVAVVFLGAIFPIIVNTMAGMREADPRLVRAARSFGATRMDLFRHILLPGVLPSMLAGIRLAVGRTVLSVVVAELYVSQAGIGHQLVVYGSAMRIDRLLVYALVVSAFGYSMTTLVRMLEARVRSWRPE